MSEIIIKEYASRITAQQGELMVGWSLSYSKSVACWIKKGTNDCYSLTAQYEFDKRFLPLKIAILARCLKKK